MYVYTSTHTLTTTCFGCACLTSSRMRRVVCRFTFHHSTCICTCVCIYKYVHTLYMYVCAHTNTHAHKLTHTKVSYTGWYPGISHPKLSTTPPPPPPPPSPKSITITILLCCYSGLWSIYYHHLLAILNNL